MGAASPAAVATTAGCLWQISIGEERYRARTQEQDGQPCRPERDGRARPPVLFHPGRIAKARQASACRCMPSTGRAQVTKLTKEQRATAATLTSRPRLQPPRLAQGRRGRRRLRRHGPVDRQRRLLLLGRAQSPELVGRAAGSGHPRLHREDRHQGQYHALLAERGADQQAPGDQGSGLRSVPADPRPRAAVQGSGPAAALRPEQAAQQQERHPLHDGGFDQRLDLGRQALPSAALLGHRGDGLAHRRVEGRCEQSQLRRSLGRGRQGQDPRPTAFAHHRHRPVDGRHGQASLQPHAG